MVFICGAIAVLWFAILTFSRATEWFEYVSSAVFLILSVTLAYRGIRLAKTPAK